MQLMLQSEHALVASVPIKTENTASPPKLPSGPLPVTPSYPR